MRAVPNVPAASTSAAAACVSTPPSSARSTSRVDAAARPRRKVSDEAAVRVRERWAPAGLVERPLRAVDAPVHVGPVLEVEIAVRAAPAMLARADGEARPAEKTLARSARRASARSGRGSSPRSRRRRAPGMTPGLIGKKRSRSSPGRRRRSARRRRRSAAACRRRVRPMSRELVVGEREDAGAPARAEAAAREAHADARSRPSRPAGARRVAHDVRARRRQLRADAHAAERDAFAKPSPMK